MNYAVFQKIIDDFKELKEFRTTVPRLVEMQKPVKPVRVHFNELNMTLVPAALADDMIQPEFHHFLEVALTSENPLIVKKLRDLFAMVKLILPADDPERLKYQNWASQYAKHCAEIEEQNIIYRAKFEEESKMFNLENNKRSNALNDYANDQFQASFERLLAGKPTLWDTILKKTLETEIDESFTLTELFGELLEYQIADKIVIIEAVFTAHRYWLDDKIREKSEEIFDLRYAEQLDVEWQSHELIYEIEGYDEIESLRQQADFEDSMNDLEDSLRGQAWGEAVDWANQQYEAGANGYDNIYGYDDGRTKLQGRLL